MVTLPNNPQECRVKAKLYEIPEDKEHFGSLADSWMKLEDEIEGALILLHNIRSMISKSTNLRAAMRMNILKPRDADLSAQDSGR